MTVTPSDLRKIPLFQNITDAHLGELMAAFERAHMKPGETLFEAGSKPNHFYLLVSGEIALHENGEARFTLSPVAPIGELGALTGHARRTTAIATKPSEVWRIGTGPLLDFFERHGDVAYPFHNNLLRIVAEKVRRDARVLEDVRQNLIRTQKAMKRLRDAVLEAEETSLSKHLCDTLDELIEKNRRGHYLVEPAFALQTSLRLDGGETVSVTEMSDTLIRIKRPSNGALSKGSSLTAVLVLPDGEMPVIGSVESVDDGAVTVRLDLLIDEYQAQLARHLTRIQMLDFVV